MKCFNLFIQNCTFVIDRSRSTFKRVLENGFDAEQRTCLLIRTKYKVPPSIRFVGFVLCALLMQAMQYLAGYDTIRLYIVRSAIMYKKRLSCFIVVVIMYVMKEKYSFSGHTHSIFKMWMHYVIFIPFLRWYGAVTHFKGLHNFNNEQFCLKKRLKQINWYFKNLRI